MGSIPPPIRIPKPFTGINRAGHEALRGPSSIFGNVSIKRGIGEDIYMKRKLPEDVGEAVELFGHSRIRRIQPTWL